MHVNAQLPYCLIVAGISFIGFLIGGFITNIYLILGLSFVLLIISFFVINILSKKKEEKLKEEKEEVL